VTKEDLLAVLDIGTAKTVALVLRIGPDEKALVLGSGLSATSGLHKGEVINEQALAASIGRALGQAEENAGYKVDKLISAVAGTPVSIFLNRGVTAIADRTEGIDHEDIVRAFDASKILPVNCDWEIIHTIPQRYLVDGQPETEILGKLGLRLEMETCIVAGQAQELSCLGGLLNNLGTASLYGWIHSGVALTNSILSAQERQNSVVLVDIGAGTVEVTLVVNQQPVYALTNDLSIGLGIKSDDAEWIKLQHGVAMVNMADSHTRIKLPGRTDKASVSHKVVAEIIEARLQEIFAIIAQKLAESDYQVPEYVVLTGGTAMLPGIAEMVNSFWKRNVRIACPPKLNGLPINFCNPAFTCIAAMAFRARLLEHKMPKIEKKRPGSLIERFSGFWRSFSSI
jgi:cell division protein FtsA